MTRQSSPGIAAAQASVRGSTADRPERYGVLGGGDHVSSSSWLSCERLCHRQIAGSKLSRF